MKDRGFLYALSAYLLWGFLPIFWKAVQTVPALEILAHRMVWSLVFLATVLVVKRRWEWIRPLFHNRRTLLTFLVTSSLLSLNWFTYIWAVNAGFIIETSLGYFINPLLNVLLGVLFLRERVRPRQWAAIVIAAAGVVYMTISYGALPWISLTLAGSFGLYGLLRKTAALEALEGLSLEMLILFIPALGYLLYLAFTGQGSFGHTSGTTSLLLALAGVVTAVPLWLFALGARRVTLVTLGLLQYIAPTIQFLIGVFVYGEVFTRTYQVGFSFIWVALLIYSVESIWTARRKPLLPRVARLGD